MTDDPVWGRLVFEEARRRAAFVETDIAEAMALQEHGYLDRLVVAMTVDGTPAVASRLEVVERERKDTA